MASGVNVKMGVSGVTQFKQGINQAKQTVKTLDAQLALSEKQFKATGDSESYMTERAELLKAKMEAQKAVIANAESALESMSKNGVERSSKAYQDMYRQLLTAKGELLDTENAMNGVEEAAENAGNEADSMNRQLKQIGNGVSFQNISDGIGKITSGLANAATKAINLGRKIFDAMVGAGSYADDLATRASRYKLTTDELQRMDKTANLIDTSVDAIINARNRLQKEVAEKGKETMGAFAALGINPDDAKDAEDLFWRTGQAIMKFANENEKEAYAQKLFGRSWNELIPLFEAGREEYEKTNASWKVLSEEQIDSLGKMDDEYQKLKENVEELKLEMLSNFAEPMAALMETINKKVQEFSEWISSDEGKAVVDSVVGQVQAALEWISKPENIDGVIKAMETILGGWELLKLAGGAVSVLELINGIRGLTAGSAAAAGAAAGASWGGAFASAVMKASPFLVFLYTLLNPDLAKTHDAIGNSDLVDENGNLTKEAKAYGYALDETGNAYIPFITDWMREAQEKAAQEHLQTQFVGDTEAAIERNRKRLQGVHALDAVETGTSAVMTGQDLMDEKAAMRRLQESSDKMNRAAEDLTGGSAAQKQSSSEMTQAATTMKGLPAVIEGAIKSGMSGIRIYIDGQEAGQVLTPYVNAAMGGDITALIK